MNFFPPLPGDVQKCFYEAAKDTRKTIFGPFSPGCNMVRTLQKELYQILPENSHQMATGRLFISLTRLVDGQNVMVSEYHSKQELVQVTKSFSLVLFRERRLVMKVYWWTQKTKASHMFGFRYIAGLQNGYFAMIMHTIYIALLIVQGSSGRSSGRLTDYFDSFGPSKIWY